MGHLLWRRRSGPGPWCTTDDSSHVFIVGNTRSTANIASSGAYQPDFQGGDYDIFCAKFSAKGVRHWGTYYGGLAADYGISCTTDGNGDLYLAGSSASLSQIASPERTKPFRVVTGMPFWSGSSCRRSRFSNYPHPSA
ncbi:MAG: hypothetical protein IPJ40_03100 [Saprospirales bacterium]|nr:hypothetical protein [Saprospirales bacterium]